MTRQAFLLTIGVAITSIAAKFRPAQPDLLDGKRTLLVVADDKALADAMLKYMPLLYPKFKTIGRMWYDSNYSIDYGKRMGCAMDADWCANVMARGLMDFRRGRLLLTIATREAILSSPNSNKTRDPFDMRFRANPPEILANPVPAPTWQSVVFECPPSPEMLKLIRPHLTPDAEILA